MLGHLPRLFDRDFAIGYFLPVVMYVVANILVMHQVGLLPTILAFDTVEQVGLLLGTTMVGLVSWLGGVILLVTNADILRLMEGYGRFNPARVFLGIEKRRYRKLKTAISKLDEEFLSCITEHKEFPLHLRIRRARLLRKMVESFPDEEHWLLPTSFGNTVRAFEVYSRVMYGLDMIPGANRLVAVIPKEYCDLVNAAKAQLDFWVNLWVLSILILIEYVAIAVYIGELRIVWAPLLVIGLCFAAYSRSTTAAAAWGDLMKGACDVYLPDLQRKLGFSCRANFKQEKSLWRGFSQAIIYRDPECMPSRDLKPGDRD